MGGWEVIIGPFLSIRSTILVTEFPKAFGGLVTPRTVFLFYPPSSFAHLSHHHLSILSNQVHPPFGSDVTQFVVTLWVFPELQQDPVLCTKTLFCAPVYSQFGVSGGHSINVNWMDKWPTEVTPKYVCPYLEPQFAAFEINHHIFMCLAPCFWNTWNLGKP